MVVGRSGDGSAVARLFHTCSTGGIAHDAAVVVGRTGKGAGVAAVGYYGINCSTGNTAMGGISASAIGDGGIVGTVCDCGIYGRAHDTAGGIGTGDGSRYGKGIYRSTYYLTEQTAVCG